ncbi:unnamed protein product [Vicia faba]|uniref:Transmembrane protein n=1 Tax=Vicia faba TaxID=3906 RepID=A0AAV0YDU8_VICFA|nr:unnamed protein product [Vicia faba]
MDAKLKSSLTFLTFILIVFFFVSLSPKVSEARALLSPLQGKDSAIGEVKGVFRTLKGDGHRFVGEMKDSGPSPGEGHKKKTNHGLS